MVYSKFPCFPPAELRAFSITRSYLEEIAKYFPNDTRLEQYELLFSAIEATEFILFLTLTTTTAITDPIVFEGLLRRFAHQLRHEVLGKRRNHSTLPIVSIIERDKVDGRLHGHLLIGKVKGKTRSREQTTYRSYERKRIFSTVIRLIHRLTYAGGKIGEMYIEPVGSAKRELADYLLKGLKENDLNIAWLATTVEFKKKAKIVHKPSSKQNAQYILSSSVNLTVS